MEVIEILSHHIDKIQNIIVVEFRSTEDEDDMVREDFIEYSFFEEFGYDESTDFDIFDSLIDEDEDIVDEEELMVHCCLLAEAHHLCHRHTYRQPHRQEFLNHIDPLHWRLLLQYGNVVHIVAAHCGE